ncbi:MAG: nucleoside deaminase [Desulfobulbaceae bacterium]|nr:nucleoside deaminase [Desulfobulbaceae bacterium]
MPDHHRFMKEALNEAESALAAGEFPVGCVIVHNQQIIARGRRQRSGGHAKQIANEVDHAEILALRDLLDRHPDVPPSKVTVYATLEPCLMCYATLLISGIQDIVYAYEDAMGGGTDLPLDQLKPLYQGMTVSITPYILRDKSLALFKHFFADCTSHYLSDTMLANYTLDQP